MSSYQRFNIVADIGNGTMNVSFIIDGKPDSSRYYTECFGVDCCVIEMRSELTNKVDTAVDDCIVKEVLKDGTADIGEKYLKAIGECATDYTDKIMRKLREYGYNEELAKLHFLGDGAMLMKHFAKLDQNKVYYIEDIHTISTKTITIWQSRMKSLRYTISTLVVCKKNLCSHKTSHSQYA